MIIPPQSTAINSRFFYFLQRFSNGFPVWRETDARDVEDAVPYGIVRNREVAANLRDVEDAVPYGARNHSTGAKPREGQAPPLRV